MRQDTHQKDQTRNTLIRQELNTFNLNNRIKNNELNWICRVEGMEPERIPEHLTDYAPRGATSIGNLSLSYRGTVRIETSEP
jgi:hypothetical protein